MAGDEREEEREFLAELKARSGQDLAQWMAAIAAQGFADKNETIDWLRAQGFPFARASWLERIHTNGGKPIYMDEPPKPAAEPRSPPAATKPAPPPPTTPRPASARARRPASRSCWRRPRAIARSTSCWRRRSGGPSPASSVKPTSSYISFAAPAEFAAVTVHAAELRLGLDLGDRPHDAMLQRPKMKGPGAAISHMLVLTDARQVNADLLGLISGRECPGQRLRHISAYHNPDTKMSELPPHAWQQMHTEMRGYVHAPQVDFGACAWPDRSGFLPAQAQSVRRDDIGKLLGLHRPRRRWRRPKPASRPPRLRAPGAVGRARRA